MKQKNSPDVPTSQRLLLILPTGIYQADAYMDAASLLDIDVTVASELPSSLESFQPDKLTTLDLSDPEKAASQAVAFAKKHPITVVVGVNDATTVTAAHIAQELGLHHLGLPAAELAASKHLQRQALRDVGVPVPEFSVHHIEDEACETSVEFPRVVKPVALSASKGVIRANDHDEFQAAVKRLTAIVKENRVDCSSAGGKYLVESYIHGAEFALEGIVVDGKLNTLAVFDKPDPLEGPFFAETIYVTPSRADPDTVKSLTDCASKAVAALGIDRGPVHVELRFNEKGAWLVELAARPIGGKCGRVLEFENGETLEGLVIRHAVGIDRAVPRLREGASGVMMLPTPKKGILRRIDGRDEARLVENVTDVVITGYAGQELIPLPEGSQYLGFLFARAETPDEVEEALRAAFEKLEFVLEN
jgi:biotin carboxylase